MLLLFHSLQTLLRHSLILLFSHQALWFLSGFIFSSSVRFFLRCFYVFFHSPQWSVRKPCCQQSVSDSLTSGVSASVTEDLTVCLPCVCPSSHQSLCDTKGTCWCGAQTGTLTDQGSAVGMALWSEKHSKNDSKKGGKKKYRHLS